jgi:hypothetical protein
MKTDHFDSQRTEFTVELSQGGLAREPAGHFASSDRPLKIKAERNTMMDLGS